MHPVNRPNQVVIQPTQRTPSHTLGNLIERIIALPPGIQPAVLADLHERLSTLLATSQESAAQIIVNLSQGSTHGSVLVPTQPVTPEPPTVLEHTPSNSGIGSQAATQLETPPFYQPQNPTQPSSEDPTQLSSNDADALIAQLQ